MGSQGEKFVRPSPFGLRTDIAAYIGVDRNLNGLTLNRDWKMVIFSDETKVVVGSNNRVYMWRRPDEIWPPECLGLRGNCRFPFTIFRIMVLTVFKNIMIQIDQILLVKTILMR